MKIFDYNKTGEYHLSEGFSSQDYTYSLEDGKTLIIALADGATSCSNGCQGAKIACETAAKYLRAFGGRIFGFPEEKIAYLLLEEIKYALGKEAAITHNDLESYSSTIEVFYLEKDTGRSLHFSLGDGAAYSTGGGKAVRLMKPLSYPRKLVPLTLTKGAFRAARIQKSKMPVREAIFLCSDALRDRLRQEPEESPLWNSLKQNDYIELSNLLDSIDFIDDCSFIAAQM